MKKTKQAELQPTTKLVPGNPLPEVRESNLEKKRRSARNYIRRKRKEKLILNLLKMGQLMERKMTQTGSGRITK
jgi:hypothetical protein